MSLNEYPPGMVIRVYATMEPCVTEWTIQMLVFWSQNFSGKLTCPQLVEGLHERPQERPRPDFLDILSVSIILVILSATIFFDTMSAPIFLLDILSARLFIPWEYMLKELHNGCLNQQVLTSLNGVFFFFVFIYF